MLQQEHMSGTALREDVILPPGVISDYVGGVLELTISGDIDHHTAGGLRQKVDREIYFYRPKTVRLRLCEIDFMDSSGLGFFMGRFQLCKTLSSTFVLVDPPPRVLRILELSGMDKQLHIEKIYHTPKKEGVHI